MGDHFVLLVDRLITESTLEAAIESTNRAMQATISKIEDIKTDKCSQKVDFGDVSTPRKLVECRICQDEDEDSNMEIPCACRGSLKYAHRRCVQRWCNEKNNITCEICHQQFKPGYTAPPPLFQLGRIPLNFRGNWEAARTDLHGPRFIAVVSTDGNFLNTDYDDEDSTSSTRNAILCRSVAVLLMVLLILRHTLLPLILTGSSDISFPLFMSIFLRIAGVILPIYVIVRAVSALQRRRHQGAPSSSYTPSDEETERSVLQTETHVVSFQ
ncbi:hypothetical protein K2173_013068 [Erythroxylum novogranatense]|uniref:RING-CH-type domain-containing protein n=1 Tax=Erythroxylum novogranatense TaxID=1862640 RepID=A0AAV8S6K9_9ROSI|nr:hypothetical protein K2173_013068 [Erythroxylum novogranatense]